MRNVIVSYAVKKAACPQSKTIRAEHIALVDIFTATTTKVEKFSGWNIGQGANMSEEQAKKLLWLLKGDKVTGIRYRLHPLHGRNHVVEEFPCERGRREHILLALKDEDRNFEPRASLPNVISREFVQQLL